MKFDIFFSICQTPVDGITPTERQMFKNFIEQFFLADQLGFGIGWIAETHLSCQVQKHNPNAVVPHFQGEIGLNTDILQMAHWLYARTKKIEVGSAVRNILCNGGPIAHAEAIRTFISLHSLDETDSRGLNIGFASGRFPFSNIPYGIHPRNEIEKTVWPVLRGRIFQEATEIFCRLLKGETIGSKDIFERGYIKPQDFRDVKDWQVVEKVAGKSLDHLIIPSFYSFDPVGVVPFEAPVERVNLTVGSADPAVHSLANEILPVATFNLSITPPKQIEETHAKMSKIYHSSGGPWKREYMPRTVLCFINDDQGVSVDERRNRAREAAVKANENYWRAIEGTLDPAKVANATDNALVGTPEDVVEQIKVRFHPDDKLLLWFDFNNHNSEEVMRGMRVFMEKVAPSF